MSRLIDDLRCRDSRLAMPWFIAPHLQGKWREHTKKVFDILREPNLPVLLIDNVADFYYSVSDQENWDLRDDFPNLAPPYPQFWCEHKLPKTIHSKEKGDTNVAEMIQNGRVGMLVTALNRSEFKGENIPENVRWVLWAEMFIDYGLFRGVTATGAHGPMFFAIDAEGRLVDRPWMQGFNAPEHNEMMRLHLPWLNPVWLTVSFLHCRNVRVEENRTPKPLAKKYKARHGVEPCVFKTLVIEPLKAVLRSEGRSGEVGLQRALHICRGHFKDYREGRGLFGKYHQLVWHPSVVRGTKGEKAPPREIEVKV